MTNESISLSGKEVAQITRKWLKETYPDIPSRHFKVTSSYDSVKVSWVDYPMVSEIEEFINGFVTQGFDGMTDSSYSIAKTYQGKKLNGIRFATTSRERSDERLAILQKELSRQEGRNIDVYELHDYRRQLAIIEAQLGKDNKLINLDDVINDGVKLYTPIIINGIRNLREDDSLTEYQQHILAIFLFRILKHIKDERGYINTYVYNKLVNDLRVNVRDEKALEKHFQTVHKQHLLTRIKSITNDLLGVYTRSELTKDLGLVPQEFLEEFIVANEMNVYKDLTEYLSTYGLGAVPYDLYFYQHDDLVERFEKKFHRILMKERGESEETVRTDIYVQTYHNEIRNYIKMIEGSKVSNLVNKYHIVSLNWLLEIMLPSKDDYLHSYATKIAHGKYKLDMSDEQAISQHVKSKHLTATINELNRLMSYMVEIGNRYTEGYNLTKSEMEQAIVKALETNRERIVDTMRRELVLLQNVKDEAKIIHYPKRKFISDFDGIVKAVLANYKKTEEEDSGIKGDRRLAWDFYTEMTPVYRATLQSKLIPLHLRLASEYFNVLKYAFENGRVPKKFHLLTDYGGVGVYYNTVTEEYIYDSLFLKAVRKGDKTKIIYNLASDVEKNFKLFSLNQENKVNSANSQLLYILGGYHDFVNEEIRSFKHNPSAYKLRTNRITELINGHLTSKDVSVNHTKNSYSEITFNLGEVTETYLIGTNGIYLYLLKDGRLLQQGYILSRNPNASVNEVVAKQGKFSTRIEKLFNVATDLRRKI